MLRMGSRSFRKVLRDPGLILFMTSGAGTSVGAEKEPSHASSTLILQIKPEPRFDEKLPRV